MVDISNQVRNTLDALVAGLVLSASLIASVSATEHSVGSGPDDWWTVYPDQHTDSGFEVDHPSWALDLLVEKPVLILDHSTNCIPCLDQESYVEAVLEDYGDEVAYENLITGCGDRKADMLFDIYDPNGGESTMPLTVILTLVEYDGEVVVGWHSMEDAAGGEELVRSLVEDAIDYYDENVAEWNV